MGSINAQNSKKKMPFLTILRHLHYARDGTNSYIELTFINISRPDFCFYVVKFFLQKLIY